jgi:ketosteroid isomerase-like protein
MINPLIVAERFFAAIAAGQQDAVRAIYAPDARVWHNTDGLDHPGQTVTENLATLGFLHRRLQNIAYDVQFRAETPEGFAQRHILRGNLATGAAFAMPAAIFCAVSGGRITGLWEYFRETDVAPLLAAGDLRG